ncbi:MAG: DUF4296 domain-containing protein [Salinibacter sp.]
MSRRRRWLTQRRTLALGLFAIVLGISLMGGCSSVSSEQKPLPDSTFTQVLTEIHLLKARRAREEPVPQGLRDSIFAHYEVSPSTFDATLRYYSHHPRAFQVLYQTVIDTLKALQTPRRGRTIPDSLQDPQQDRGDR